MDEIKINRSLMRITYEILEHNKGVDDVVIAGIKTRGVYLAQRIQEMIYQVEGIRVPIISLDVYSWRDDIAKYQEHPNFDIKIDGKKVILVDDVLFKGRTIRAAMDALMDHGRPSEIQLAVLIDRGHRELPIRADYVGKNIPSSIHEVIKVHVQEIDKLDGVFISK